MPCNNLLTFHPPILAHRGASFYAPENTLAAFRKAKKLGINWVELDVMLTADEEVVVIHDETVNRTTNGKGLVIGRSYDYIKSLDAGSWFDPIFSEERIPTLGEALQLFNELQLAVNVEIKAQRSHEELTVKKVLAAIQQQWQQEDSRLLISSFSVPILQYVRQYSANALLGLLMDKWLKDWQQLADSLDCVAVNVNQKLLTTERVTSIKNSGRQVLAYTVDELSRARELFSLGVDAVFSNRLYTLAS